MAVIGTIRKQSGLLIVLVGVALVLFLLGDLFNSGSGYFTQNQNIVGIIAGDEIDQMEYETRVQEAIDKQFGPEGASEQAKKSVRERIWMQMVDERIIKREYAKLGISVSPDELLDQVKNTQPGSVLYQYFTNPQTGQIIEQFQNPQTGGLDGSKVLSAIQNLLSSDNAKDWLPIEAAIKEDVAMRKYTTLISKGLHATDSEGKAAFKEKNETAAFTYVVKEFAAVTVDENTITDADLKAYYNAHKHEEKFQMETEMRNLKVASFILQPSQDDMNALMAEVEEIKAAFVADSNDTAFVAENSDSKPETLITYYPEANLPPSIKDAVVTGNIGDVFGAYIYNGAVVASKLTEIKLSPDSVQASHILISVSDGDTNKIKAAKIKLDSLKTVAKAKKNFGELAKEFSEDFGSAEKNGELDWFTRGRMVAAFEKACFEGEVGDMPIVETQFGVHLIHITNQTADKKSYLLASVDRVIAPSKTTTDAAYRKASKFATEHNTTEKFEQPLPSNERPEENVMIEPMDGVRMGETHLPGLGQVPREVTQWIFDSEVGTVSPPFELDDKIVVLALTEVRPKGVLPFELAKPLIKPEVIKEKQAETIIAELGSFATLEDAAKNLKTQAQPGGDVRFSDNNLRGGVGYEPKVVGTVAGLAQGSVSKPIVGNRGVFVVRVDTKTAAPEGGDTKMEQQMLGNNIASRSERMANEALKKAVGVEDLRSKFY